MPLPVPHPGEKTDDFMTRCMGDKTAMSDFPDNKQRLAVCFKQAKIRDQKMSRDPSDLTIQASVEFDLNASEPEPEPTTSTPTTGGSDAERVPAED